MSITIHEVTLSSPQKFGGKLPPHDLGVFLTELPLTVRGAVSMALRNRSSSKGKRPDWLSQASDIRFAGHDEKSETTLYFEAPTLGEAAPELYRQGELFQTRPDAEDTALDVFGDVLLDVAHNNADSERFDHPLLKRLSRFRRFFSGLFTEARLSGRRSGTEPPRLTPDVILTARRFYDETPKPRGVRLVGTLDMVRVSNRTFALRVGDEPEAGGCLTEGSIEEMGLLLNKTVLVTGKALFRPSGRLLRVDAETFRLATDADKFFTKMPEPRSLPKVKDLVRRQQEKGGVRAVVGKWPGEESDEEIERALKELG